MSRLRSLALALAAALCAVPAHALLIRADRDDDEYVELAARYPSALSLGAGQGEGVLVAPRWILTSAHRAVVLRDLKPRPLLRVGGGTYAIAAIVVHPDWKGGRDDDVALIQLATPVADVTPAPLGRAQDDAAKGIVIVAHGASGKLGAAKADAPRRKRASINTIAEERPKTFLATIKAEADASDLQGAALREETGAPAYIDDGSSVTLAGILAAVEEPRPDAPSGSVGEREIFARVSAYVPWIEATIR
jgi:hypothetical protein